MFDHGLFDHVLIDFVSVLFRLWFDMVESVLVLVVLFWLTMLLFDSVWLCLSWARYGF